jgi:intracellular septation protein
MKFLFDFFPILLFFVAFKFYDIYVATTVAIVATFVQIGYYWFRHRKVEPMHLVTLVLIVVFGGATLVLHDEVFIKWKPTILYWGMALAFLGSQYIGGKNLTQRMMDKAVTLKVDIWGRLNLMWVLFWTFLGVANLYVMYHFDTATWVNFKLFGLMGLMIVFIVAQSIYMAPYIETEENEKE